ncbi:MULTISPECIES: DDE-type integrase/transposase/recombinase [Bacillus]|uniref:Integrase core domain protein n=4 Tax=Bacillus cereus group TaxID=86661 RepID=A0AAN0W829_BACCE|nr:MULTISPECIES: DDE-type integrase/transposase/recombinase [Bacillus]AJI08701.1 integrase core domain protein [Bacillus cereus 03BB108]AJI12269.1 integrase core domain protein [Bacillus cereus 03BB108]EEM55931.1 integrase [Bacillus thuringiensis serovar monterrey BGSC 4AJ1]MCU5384791.1 DDE-type integrase/transposase/recombinase [Bacillus cereus]MDA1606712.1 DDE-type integrase/transposase/recombinase [Bacillus cereus group sp. TH208-1LC]
MLQETEFIKWCKDNGMSDLAQDLINQIRMSPPSRKVKSGRGNVPGRYPSRKMGVTIQYESHRIELNAIYKMEYDLSVLEYYDQPNPIFLEYMSKNNRKVTVNSTPDFFVIRENEAGWEEWKTEEELLKLSQQSPNRYMRDLEGNWRCPPGEKFAERFGLKFYLRSSKEINWNFSRNIQVLEDYITASEWIELDEQKIRLMRDIVSSKYGITIEEVLESYYTLTIDDIYSIIARKYVYFDLNKYVLTEHHQAPLFLNQKLSQIYEMNFAENTDREEAYTVAPNLLQQGTKLVWDGKIYNVIHVGNNIISLVDEKDNLVNISQKNFKTLDEEGAIRFLNQNNNIDEQQEYRQTLLEGVSPKALEEAYGRYKLLKEHSEEGGNNQYSNRTIRRWKKAFEESERLYGNGFLGLLPKKQQRGNRMPKIDTVVQDLMKEVIEKYYHNIKQLSVKAVYGLLIEECRKKGLSIPSYVTFTKYVNGYSSYEVVKSRKGKRAAYSKEFWYLEGYTPKHGDRPFEIAHIDHTELDIELVLMHGKEKVTRRPYLTLLIDAYCRKILAHYITFDSPSYRSIMMVLRECVRRNGRLPNNLVVDGGKEFHSLYFDVLCAQYNINKKERPPAKARFGSVIERLFGVTNSLFIHNLQGNTQLTKEVRVVTKSTNPKNSAIWTLEKLNALFYEWIDYYENTIHAGLGTTPKNQFDIGIAIGGKREMNLISYDQNFILSTLPSTPRGKGLVQPGKGVVFNNVWYWNEGFKNPKIEKTNVDLKYDPFNVGILYAYVNKKWVKCISEYYYLLEGKTHKQLQIITEEIRYKLGIKGRISLKQIATFIPTIESHEKVIKQAIIEQENQKSRGTFGEVLSADDMEVQKSLSKFREIDIEDIPSFKIIES